VTHSPIRRRAVEALVRIAGTVMRWMPPGSALYRGAFLPAYFAYKRHLEDPFAWLLGAYPGLLRGGHVIDVGANVGYTATLFAGAVDPGYRVFAFEPDAGNFAVLADVIRRRGLDGIVEARRAAVGAAPGTVKLWHNPAHPADHRVFSPALARTGRDPALASEVPMVSVDSFLAERGGTAPVAFIKIDVQGYEHAVLAGMERTLSGAPYAAVAVEYAPADLADQAQPGETLLAFFLERGYALYPLFRGRPLTAATPGEIHRLAATHGYLDLLCARRPPVRGS